MKDILIASSPQLSTISLYFRIKDSLDKEYKDFFEPNDFNQIEPLLDNNRKFISKIVLYRSFLKDFFKNFSKKFLLGSTMLH